MAMNRDPDFLPRRGVYKQLVSSLARTFLDESGGLQLTDHFFPTHSSKDNLPLGYWQGSRVTTTESKREGSLILPSEG